MHTPEPWSIGGKYGHLKSEILALNGSKAIATVWTREFDERKGARHMATVPSAEGEANARLIAAAPELLEALEVLAAEPSDDWRDATDDDDEHTRTPRQRALKQAHIAIAKAKGKSNGD